jgi:galactokinase
VALDTGTDRPGLEKSTYKVRREECDAFAEELFAKSFINRPVLADVKDFGKISEAYASTAWAPHLERLAYLVSAQENFRDMIAAWRRGDAATVGALFRDDGLGLRDLYCISGPELETMCDIARTVDGVYGERMLGGGDKGAAGAIVRADAVAALKAAVARAYPLAHPFYKCAVHEVRVTTGVATFEGAL